eukprot:5284860-Prymnesium_polylepis.1
MRACREAAQQNPPYVSATMSATLVRGHLPCGPRRREARSNTRLSSCKLASPHPADLAASATCHLHLETRFDVRAGPCFRVPSAVACRCEYVTGNGRGMWDNGYNPC